MFKLIVFAVLLSLAAARPSILGPAIVHGPIVHTIPAAISHQSHVQIHSSPVITSVVSPVLHPLPLVHAPLLHSHIVDAHHPIWLHR